MASRVDFAVYAPDEKLQLVVEVKNRFGASPHWAAQMRRNLLSHSLIPESAYFLLALPDRFFLWRDNKDENGLTLPDYVIDSSKILGQYINDQSIQLDQLSEVGLELLVSRWLSDIIEPNLSMSRNEPDLKWIFETGLYDAIRNGSVESHVAA